jgi:hypothetical protein
MLTYHACMNRDHERIIKNIKIVVHNYYAVRNYVCTMLSFRPAGASMEGSVLCAIRPL